ncbi:MAG TPA: aspartate aminotransferase family protein [Bacillales bacterium]
MLYLLEVTRETNSSFQFMKEACTVMPGGVTANIKFFSPYPLVMKRADQAYLTDLDGNQYIDYLLSYSALILGHGHPKIAEAIQKQIENSGTWLFGTPHQLEVDFGKMIQHFYPSIELLRYTNSGTEATLLALRFASAYTGKYKVAKFEGHYHGGHNQVLFSINPDIGEAGPFKEPNVVPDSKGLSKQDGQQTIILPFNDLEASEEILRKHCDEIGALVLEPVQGGFIPAEQRFIEGIRQLTKELGIVLIFDEVKTGFRVSLGGAQEVYGIKPDLTTLGKVIGGGFPIGIVGGKKEILMESAPVEESNGKELSSKDVLFHSGTYNGHPMILAAGMETVKVLEKEIDHVFQMTDILRKALESLFFNKGIDMQTLGIGSMFNIALTDRDIYNYRDYQKSNFELRKRIDMALLDKGVYTKPLNRYSLSTCHGEEEIAKTVEAYRKVLMEI